VSAVKPASADQLRRVLSELLDALDGMYLAEGSRPYFSQNVEIARTNARRLVPKNRALSDRGGVAA
jgi:hypothetical protein